MQDIGQTSIELHHNPLTLEAIAQALHSGRVPIILISTWQLNRSRVPHWVTVCAIDDQFVYLHDPEIDVKDGETVADKQHLPVDKRVFSQISRYGRNRANVGRSDCWPEALKQGYPVRSAASLRSEISSRQSRSRLEIQIRGCLVHVIPQGARLL